MASLKVDEKMMAALSAPKQALTAQQPLEIEVGVCDLSKELERCSKYEQFNLFTLKQ